MAAYNICLDIGGTKVLGAIFNENKEIIYRLKKKSKEGGDSTENVEQVIIAVVEEMIRESGIDKKAIHAIAAGMPGVVNQKTGIVLFCPNLPFKNYDLKSVIEKRFGVPFYLGNDVNVGVLGEYVYGAAKGYKNVVGLFPGTGLGGGLILDGKLYTGTDHKAGECGHIVVQPDGPLCGCGQRGCLEAFSSKTGMSNYIREQVGRGRVSMMADAVADGVFKSKKLKKALNAGDVVAMEAVERACHYLAIGSGAMINIFSPDVIIYGGGVMEAMGDYFLERILKEVDRYCMPSIRNTVELKKAALGDDSNIYGALAMIEGY